MNDFDKQIGFSGLKQRRANAVYKYLETIKIDIKKQPRADGSIVLKSAIPLEPYPYRLTERLKHWATIHPQRVFIGRKNETGKWEELCYGETFSKVKSISSALLHKNISANHPIVILSENSIEHALIMLAAMHIGIPSSSIAPAYSLRSLDFDKLKYIFQLLTPGLIFVQDGKKYEKALNAVANEIEIVTVNNPLSNFTSTDFNDLVNFSFGKKEDKEVGNAYESIQPDTVAKILFTSGSTGLPKGVINTHGNISANWQQITQTFPFMKEDGLEFIDWLPWNHTFGGNHNLGLAIFNGGSFYIDDGNPTPQGILTTVSNLKERRPTIYFNVPKGFEELISFFKKDETLRKHFFEDLKMIFYAGAGMPQHVWDEWEDLSIDTIGEKIRIGTALGSTETSPSTLFASEPGGFAGLLGVPVPGLELKLVEVEGKMEARYRGKNVFPGYWRQMELTQKAFDEEGFYCSGDALKFFDENAVNKGMVFDGRISEDFKLNTGTWVRVGNLRSQMIKAGEGLIQDVVIIGHDRDYIAAIVFVNLENAIRISGLGKESKLGELVSHKLVREKLQQVLEYLASKSTGTATLIKRAALADFSLSIEKGEITDKGTINQRMIIQQYAEWISKIYREDLDHSVLEIRENSVKNSNDL